MSSTTTTTSTTSTTTTFPILHEIGFVEPRWTTVTTTTTTTTPPSYLYEWGLERKAGLSQGAELVSVVLPTPTSGIDPYSLKTYVPFDGNLGIFDGAGANKVETGEGLYGFTSLAPRNTPSYSSTTSTTSTSTTT